MPAEPPLHHRLLGIATEHEGDHCRLALTGVLGADTVKVLEEHIDRFDCCAAANLTIDLTRLDHLDPTGARVLYGIRLYAAARGCNIRLAGASQGATIALQEARHQMGKTGISHDPPGPEVALCG
jgi:ABC-type transporter Mla MlaB component